MSETSNSVGAQDFVLTMERPASLAETAAKKLREGILSGQLKPGTRLIEADVSQQFGISRSTLRQALHTLNREGLIEIQKNRGTYVASPRSEDIEHMSLLRGLIEGAAARMVAARRDPAGLARLRAIVERQRQAIGGADREGFIDLHWAFHQGICEEAGNPFILQSWTVLGNTIRLYYRLVMNIATAVRDNGLFCDYLERESPDAAEELLRGQLLVRAYHHLKKPIPASVLPYIRRYVVEGGRVVLGHP
jgi:DNA-binding GntR family transcriptional regulator